MTEKCTEILVIGGGPAGLAAAEAASSRGRQVTVIDENPDFGGQIWRAEKRKLTDRAADLVASLEEHGVEMISACTCVAALGNKRILALSGGDAFPIVYEKLIIATGARELFIPFPGWTLPGVYGAGGLQALVKSGYDISGKRIVVAGTGPLLLAVAAYLKKKGGDVLFIAERARLRGLVALGIAAARTPGKIGEALKLRKDLRGIPYRTETTIAQALGEGSVEGVSVRRRGSETRIDCEILALGYHLVPNIETAEMMGCGTRKGAVITFEDQQTTVTGVFCAGEPTGVGGLELSLLQGKIAGHSAAGDRNAAQDVSKQAAKHRRFATAMENAFRIPSRELRRLADDDTILCRCEDVPYGKVQKFNSFNEAKLQTRLGMGFCQGRVCGAACEALFGWERNSVRPPLVPLRISELANLDTEID